MRLSLLQQDIRPVITRALEASQDLAEECGVRFELVQSDVPCPALVDADRIIQVMVNLLGNAARLSPRGECFEILVEQNDDRVQVRVSRRGPGISPRGFEKPTRAEPALTFEGRKIGLTLSVCETILDRHRGHIGFAGESRLEDGFYLDLPALPSEACSDEASSRRRILHVEDDSDVVQVVSKILGKDFEVTQAGTLEQATGLLALERYHLMILDVGLPDGSGLSLIPLAQNLTQPLPIVVFSGLEVGDEILDGVAATLTKTRATNAKLLETVQRAIEMEPTRLVAGARR